MFPLGLLSAGEKGEVVEIRGGECSACDGNTPKKDPACRMEDMGLREGKTVEMLNNSGKGAMLIKIDESRIAIGRGMAMKVMVRRQ